MQIFNFLALTDLLSLYVFLFPIHTTGLHTCAFAWDEISKKVSP